MNNIQTTLQLTPEEMAQGWVIYNGHKRRKCEVWTRVMGYMRPVSHFNTGKKSEFCSRRYFQQKLAKLDSNVI